MRTCASFAVLGVAVFLINPFSVRSASAQSFSFPAGGFTTTNVCANSATPPPACQVLTNGFPSNPQVTSSGNLRVTKANLNQHGSAWFKLQQPLASGFTTAFQFQISNTNLCFFCSFPADGLALVIQNDPSGTGAIGYTGNGQNMAYGNNDISTASGPGSAILNSLAIELDTHQNSDYSDPDGNHIAVQSCGPNNSSTLSATSADHNYVCPNGSLAKLALQSLPAGLSLTDGLVHTITVNYLPPGTCTSGCNNLTVYFDSTLILQTTLDITQQLNLTSGSNAYIGFTAATGSVVENNDIVSWSFSQWPLSPITINQPVQPSTPTNFNYTSTLSAVTDYSQSGLPPSSFQGLVMQGTVQTITDQQFSDLVNNTPFQGSSCQHQDTGNGTYACVTTTDLCTTPTNQVPAGANCLTTGTNPLINVSNTYNLDPSQKPLIAPGYIMGKDNALGCGAGGDNSCKGLVSIFSGINGDIITNNGHTNNFNSVLIPIYGGVQPNTSVTTNPPLNNGWINGPFSVDFNSVEIVPGNNTNPPSTLPTIASIGYQATGANLPSPSSGNFNGATGTFTVPVTVAGTTDRELWGQNQRSHRPFADGERAAGAVGDVADAGVPVDVEHAEFAGRNLGSRPAILIVNTVAQKVVVRNVIKSLRGHSQSRELIREGVGRAAIEAAGAGRLQRASRQADAVDRSRHGLAVDLAIPLVGLGEGGLLVVRGQQHEGVGHRVRVDVPWQRQAHGLPGVAVHRCSHREHAAHVMVVVHGNAELLQVVAALAAASRLTGRLNGRKQQGDEGRDNRDHHQQLDQGEASATVVLRLKSWHQRLLKK